jgi:hypothetical protein
MSDQPPPTELIERLRERVRLLEIEAASARARYEEARDTLAMAEGRRRARRMPEVAQLPMRVAGGLAGGPGPDPEGDDAA